MKPARKRNGLRANAPPHDEWHDTLAIGSVLSGEWVHLNAGQDLLAEGAQIAGTGDVALIAGRDQTLTTAENLHTEYHYKQVRKSGVFSGGGFGLTIGSKKTTTTADVRETMHSGSLIGSTDGRADLIAERDLIIIGSDVFARSGIGIFGESITIAAAEDYSHVVETQKVRQSGINISLKGGVVDTAMAVRHHIERADQVQDERLAALHLAKAGQALFSNQMAGLNNLSSAGKQLGDLTDTARSGQTQGGGGLSLRIGIGTSSSSSRTEYSATQTVGSRIASEGDVIIHARGDGQGNGGDLSVIGSRIEGANITLSAANDLWLRSHQQTQEQLERNKSSSGEIGVTIGSEAGIGVYVSASMAKGNGAGHGLTHTETIIDAGKTLTLISGRDTTLEGAQARGDAIIARIGRDLTMISQQDSNDYHRKDMSAGIDVAVGTGGASVSGNYSQSKIDSTYTSVKEQTGFQAGMGGYDIHVAAHTHLVGAAIASLAAPERNRFETASLSWEHLINEAEYKARSFGVSGGVGSGGGSFSPSISPPQHGKARSTTEAAIADGTLIVHDGSGSGITRGVTELQQDGLKEIFDQRKVSENMELGQLAGEMATELIDDYFNAKLRKAQAPIDELEKEQKQLGDVIKTLPEGSQAHAETAAEIDRLGQEIDLSRARRDAGHWMAISKTLAAVGVSALTGNTSLGSLVNYVGITGGIAFWDEAAGKAMRGHNETLVIKVTCHEKAQTCADLAENMPEKGDADATARRLEYLRANGMSIEYVVEIPEGANKIAINGILNDTARAAQVQVGHVAHRSRGEENVTFYLQYNATKGGWLPDLMQAGYDKFISPINKDYSATTSALVVAVQRQGGNHPDVQLNAHSWGTIVSRNTLNILAGSGYLNENLKVAAFGPAVRPGALVNPVKRIVGEERYYQLLTDFRDREYQHSIIPALSFFSGPSDPVSSLVGFNWVYSRYTDNTSKDHLPGAVRTRFWASLPSFYQVWKSTVNAHSCYGLNCNGNKNNWTTKMAWEWERASEPTQKPTAR